MMFIISGLHWRRAEGTRADGAFVVANVRNSGGMARQCPTQLLAQKEEVVAFLIEAVVVVASVVAVMVAEAPVAVVGVGVGVGVEVEIEVVVVVVVVIVVVVVGVGVGLGVGVGVGAGAGVGGYRGGTG